MATYRNKVNEKSVFRPSAPRLMDQVREVLRYHHYGKRTEEAYMRWIKGFICFHNKQHPKDMGKAEIEAYLSHLAVKQHVAASTQNQAFNGLLFLYKQVLDLPFADDIAPVRSQKPVRLPVVLSQNEIVRLLDCMSDESGLMARIMYGGGLRLMELLRLRVQDIDFDNGYLTIRAGKGDKDRTTLLPVSVRDKLRQHLLKVRKIFEIDLREDHANVWLPGSLAKKYPNAPKSWEWQYLFPSKSLSKDPQSGEIRRHHVNESGLQKAIRGARSKADINKRVTSHTLRHSFATHLLESGTNIRVLQKLMGHADVKTTEIYTHVLKQNLDAVISPLDTLEGLINDEKRTA